MNRNSDTKVKKDLKQEYQERYYKALPYEVVHATVYHVLSLAEKKLKKKANQLKILDVGSGHGDYTEEFSKYTKKVVGVEPYADAYKYSIKNRRNKKINYRNNLVEDLKTKEKFDLVVCLTTIEHMPNAERSFIKIYKMMRSNSILYLTAPNKLWPYDNHYNLPFLSWLPLPIADMYLKLTGRGNSYGDCSYSMTYFQLRCFLKKFKWEFEFITPDIKAGYLGCGKFRPPIYYSAIRNLGVRLIRIFPFFWVLSKGFIVVIYKK